MNGMIPYLSVGDAAAALDFYARAFGAVEDFRLVEPSGKVGHAEFSIGGSTMFLADEYPDFGALSPDTIGGSPVKFRIVVDDADAAMARALAAGGIKLRPVKLQFHGDRTGMVQDPFGFAWILAEVDEIVSPDEMQRRWSAMLAG